jgi:hypothetical protein
MRVKVFVSFSGAGHSWETIEGIFLRAGRPDLASRGRDFASFYTAWYAGESAELDALRSELREAGIDWSERREHLYTDRELAAFPFLRLRITRAEQGMGGPEYGTTFDLSAGCTECGSGAVQTSELVLKPSELPTRAHILETLGGEFLASPKIAEALAAARVSGLELRATRSCRSGRVRDLPDVAATWELFGNSGLRTPLQKSHFAQPLLLVRPRVMHILRSAGARHIAFDPVRFAAG